MLLKCIFCGGVGWLEMVNLWSIIFVFVIVLFEVLLGFFGVLVLDCGFIVLLGFFFLFGVVGDVLLMLFVLLLVLWLLLLVIRELFERELLLRLSVLRVFFLFFLFLICC